jgi:hypothetical protein
VYAALARSVLTEPDADRIAKDVAKLRERHPRADDDEIVEKLIARTAIRCGLVGAAAAAPGGLLALLPMAADLSYQALALQRLVRSIAFVYGKPTTPAERGIATAAGLAAGGGAGLLRRGAARTAARLISRRLAWRAVPVVAGLAGAATAAAAAVAVGRQAAAYFRTRPRRLR